MHIKDLAYKRVFRPLQKDHPLVTDGTRCGKCHEPFFGGQRVTLAAMHQANRASTVEALPLHATCAYAGLETDLGEIERIKDGDGSPFPVVLTNGEQAGLEECGLSD